jgi:hypothetical protein
MLVVYVAVTYPNGSQNIFAYEGQTYTAVRNSLRARGLTCRQLTATEYRQMSAEMQKPPLVNTEKEALRQKLADPSEPVNERLNSLVTYMGLDNK